MPVSIGATTEKALQSSLPLASCAVDGEDESPVNASAKKEQISKKVRIPTATRALGSNKEAVSKEP
jgi:hypothetical protein